MCLLVCVRWAGLHQPVLFFLRSASLLSFLEVDVLSVSMDACFRSSSVIRNTGLFFTSWETHEEIAHTVPSKSFFLMVVLMQM